MKVEITWEDIMAAAADRGVMMSLEESEAWLHEHEDELRNEVASAVSTWVYCSM